MSTLSFRQRATRDQASVRNQARPEHEQALAVDGGFELAVVGLLAPLDSGKSI